GQAVDGEADRLVEVLGLALAHLAGEAREGEEHDARGEEAEREPLAQALGDRAERRLDAGEAREGAHAGDQVLSRIMSGLLSQGGHLRVTPPGVRTAATRAGWRRRAPRRCPPLPALRPPPS